MSRKDDSLGKLVSDLFQITKRTDDFLTGLSKHKREIQQYYQPRAKFERWRDSNDGRAWKVKQYSKQQERCAICSCDIELKGSHIDHIKPLSRFPNLAVDLSNLQITCPFCNTSKQANVIVE